MALSLEACFNVQKYSTHVLNLKYPGGEGGRASEFQTDGEVKKGKRKRVTISECLAVKTVHVNAAILATKSEVLDRLLNSEMQAESPIPSVTLRSEEEAELMCTMLKYCYCSEAIEEVASSREKVLTLLVLADKFDVSGCLEDCAKILQGGLSTIEDASLFLSLPETLQQQPVLQAFVETSRQSLAEQLQDLDQLFSTEKYLSLSREVLKIALEGNQSRVRSENTCFCLVWGWVAENCKGPSARKAALGELLPALKFGHMTGDFLLSISSQPDMTRPSATALVKEALRFKMGDALGKPGSFRLNEIDWRLDNPQDITFAVGERDLVDTQEGDHALIAEVFVDGYIFHLKLLRVNSTSFQLALSIHGWRQLQNVGDQVSLTTQIWWGSCKPSWSYTCGDCAMGSIRRSPVYRILSDGGKSIREKYLKYKEIRMLKLRLAVEWHT